MKRIISPLIGLGLLATALPASSAPPANAAGDTLVAEGHAFVSHGKLDAALWAYRQAANAGNIEGTFAAGEVLLIQGQSSGGRERVLKLSEGLGYIYRAATNRHAQACAELSNVLQSGIGVQTNLIDAYAWLSVAAQRDPAFRADLDKLVVRFDPDEILQAQRIARDYSSGHWPAPVARPVDQGDDRLKIQGMTLNARGALIILNGVTLALGETGQISPTNCPKQSSANRLTVSCYAIAQDHALIAVAGEPNLKLLAINKD